MNANELDKWIENSPYTEQEEVIVLLRQLQAEIEALKKSCFEFQNASIDLAKKNAFLEDWKKTWSPYIKDVHGINTSILRKAQEK